MSEKVAAYKHKLSEARVFLEYIFDQVGDRWETPVYSEGANWTVRQIAIHLAVSDKGHNNMIMAIAQGQNTIPEDFDLERFNRRSVEKRAETTPDELRQSLRATAAERVAWLDTCDDTVLEKKGRHGSMQILSIAEILDVIAGHDRVHGRDIAKALGISI
ncbi:MAG: maleylpyruvate isomerase N-terminal domain-containing protein [Anaerolineaceae bacterium]|nr:maleylpyruvate isomerase N-terminal domain-containing protein [Anaerolineaceae bacterium]